MNRTGWICALLLATSGQWAVAEPATGNLEVTVPLPAGSTSEVRAALCSSLSQFLEKEPPVAQAAAAPDGTVAMLLFTNVPPGSYAIRAYLDVNGNQQLERDWLGRPREPWAFSNDARGKPSKKTWERAVFIVRSDPAGTPTVLRLELNH